MDRTIKRRMLCGLTALAVIAAGIGTPALGNIGLDLDISVSAADIVDSGFCGDPAVNEGKNVTWSLDGEGTLTISGEGAMADYNWNNPWQGKNIKTIVIENGVKNISNTAFSDCAKVQKIVIPKSVASIGDKAFISCASLTNIDVSIDNIDYSSLNGILFDKNKTRLICCPAAKTSVTIPDSVGIIEDVAFYECKSLTEIVIPNSVKTIGEWAFCGCNSLTSVTISNQITTLEKGIFQDCISLKNVNIPKGVTKIDAQAFSECHSLNNITIPNSVTSIGYYAFGKCKALTKVTIPNSVKSVGVLSFGCCDNLKSITIPASVSEIGDYAFGFINVNYDGYNQIMISNEKLEGFTISGYNNTTAEKYAKDNEFRFISLGDTPSNSSVKVTPKYTLKDGETAPDLTKLAITVFDSTGTIAAEVKTDKNGRAELGDLAEDKYTLKIELDGFAPRSMEYTPGSDPGEIAVCKYGDCDGDGKIGFGDLGLMQQKLCDWDVEYVYPETADTDGDGKNSLNDLGTLQQYLCDWNIKLGKSDSFDDSVELPIIPV